MLRDGPREAAPSTSPSIDERADTAARLIGRCYFGTAGAVALFAALSVLLLGDALGADWRRALLAGLLVYAAGCGVAGGTLLSRVLNHYLREADEREQRFRSLL